MPGFERAIPALSGQPPLPILAPGPPCAPDRGVTMQSHLLWFRTPKRVGDLARSTCNNSLSRNVLSTHSKLPLSKMCSSKHCNSHNSLTKSAFTALTIPRKSTSLPKPVCEPEAHPSSRQDGDTHGFSAKAEWCSAHGSASKMSHRGWEEGPELARMCAMSTLHRCLKGVGSGSDKMSPF